MEDDFVDFVNQGASEILKESPSSQIFLHERGKDSSKLDDNVVER